MKFVSALSILGLMAIAPSAMAGPSSLLQDTYWGGLDTYYGYAPSPANGDSVGGGVFNISDATAARTSRNTLSITIDTAYAGHSGTDGTVYGDLLLNPQTTPGRSPWRAASVTLAQLLGNWYYDSAGNRVTCDANNQHCTEVQVQTGVTPVLRNGRPTYDSHGNPITTPVYSPVHATNAALVNDDSILNFANGSYFHAIQLATNTTNRLGDVWQPGDWSYAVTNGVMGLGLYRIRDNQIVLSSAPGCTDTWPIQGNCGWFYRAGEAVQVVNTTADEFVGAATVSVVNDRSITYNFSDYGVLGYDFAMSWAMTCANDIIQGEFNVPAPGSLALLLTGLLGIGAVRWRRGKPAFE